MSRPVLQDTVMSDKGPIVVVRQTAQRAGSPQRTAVAHSYAALVLYTGGHSRVQQNGEWNLGQGDVLIVPAGQPHRFVQLRRPEYWGVAFCVPCFAAESSTALLRPFERVRDGASAVVHLPTARQGFVEGLFRELAAQSGPHEAPGDTRDAIHRSLLTLILNEVDRAAGPCDRSVGATSGVVVDSLRFIERNCLRPITLSDVGAAIGRSPTYVTHRLKQATGRSARQWIVSGRMAEARRRLLHSNERVDVIAERVGYADPTHFIRMFRRTHGATPAAWRVTQSLSRQRR